ncbi:MAG: hypothetical protein AAF361_11245, partial [Bacteroidota bacterium]
MQSGLINNLLLKFSLVCYIIGLPLSAQEVTSNTDLDKKVMEFLDSNKRKWRDMNVPASDGQLLFDIITK